MIYCEQILYSTGLDEDKELAIARWLEMDINERTRRIVSEAIRDWDEGGSGSFSDYLQFRIQLEWLAYSLDN